MIKFHVVDFSEHCSKKVIVYSDAQCIINIHLNKTMIFRVLKVGSFVVGEIKWNIPKEREKKTHTIKYSNDVTKPTSREYIPHRSLRWGPGPINPFSTRPHQNAFWYNNSWLGFLKILNYVPKEREKISAKNEPPFVTVAMAHRNYFRQNNLWILKLATYTKIGDHYSTCRCK